MDSLSNEADTITGASLYSPHVSRVAQAMVFFVPRHTWTCSKVPGTTQYTTDAARATQHKVLDST